MADSYSVKAILSAVDSGFTSTLKSCSNLLGSIDKKVSGFSFGILAGAGQAAFGAITNGVTGLISEINSSNAAWKTFEGNMGIIGKGEKEINSVRNELQKFAEQTIYSSSDMASTFAQLEAVGTKNTLALVKGFGGLAAAAENPKQAMKTLSQQGTQMAGKPKVAWADFKLMMEQTPAGMAAVAKAMGMTTSQLVQKIQKGEVATNDFFAAVEKVGTSKDFENLATQYKTAGQAMGGLQETLSNKLTPAFEVLSQTSIGSLEGIIDRIAKIDGEKVAKNVSKWLEKAEKYWTAFKDVFSGVVTEVTEAFNAVKTSFTKLNGEFGSTESVTNFKSILQTVADVIKGIADIVTKHADKIALLIKYLPQIAIGLKAFSVAKTVAPYIGMFASGIGSIAQKVGGGLAGKLLGIGDAQEKVGKKSSASGKKMLTTAKAFALTAVAVLAISVGFALLAQSAIALSNAGGLAIGVMAGLVISIAALGIGMVVLLKSLAPMGKKLVPVATAMLAMGGAVVLVAAGFAILAATSIQLANAGGLAIGIMAGMVATIALLAVGAAALGPALTAGAVGFIAFGAAVVLVATGALLASAALAVVAAVLPTVATYGMQGAAAIAALGASMIVFAAGAVTAGAAIVVMSAGLVVFAAAVVVASAAMVVFAAGMVTGAAGTLLMATALIAVSSQMKTISKEAKSAKNSLTSMRNSISVVESGLNALESKAKSALNTLKNAFSKTASEAKTEGTNVGKNFAMGMQPGLLLAVNIATTSTAAAIDAFRSGYGSAYSAGAYISEGFAAGMRSQLAAIQAAAAAMAAAADAAVRAKARIHSPSKESEGLGEYWGEGFVGGIASMAKDAWKAAESIVAIPNIATPKLATAYGYTMSSDYEYSRNHEYVIEVAVPIDGREVARATVNYTEEELNRKQSRDYRKQGRK